MGQQLVGNLGEAAVARDGAIILAAVTSGALSAGVDADQPPGDVVVDRSREVRAKEHAVDVERGLRVAVVVEARRPLAVIVA